MRALFHGDYIGSDRSALHGRVKSPTRPGERASHLALTRQNCYLSAKMNLPKNIPKDLSDLLQAMATDFPRILRGKSRWSLPVGLVDLRRVRRELQRCRLRGRHPTRP